jgi:putative lipoprotein
LKKLKFLRLTVFFLITAITILSGCSTPQTTSTAPPTSESQGKVAGTITYLEKIALPAGAIVDIKLLDVSKQDAPAVNIGEQVITTSGQQMPFAFEIKYNTNTIDPRFTYAVRANITVDGNLWFTTDTRYAVITQGNPSRVEMILKRVMTATPVANLENTIWVLQAYGQPGNMKSPLKDSEITATFDSTKGQVAGSAGVNKYFGGYELKGNKLTISKQMASTAMAGPQPLMDQEKEYLTTLLAADSYKIDGDKLTISCGSTNLVFIKK